MARPEQRRYHRSMGKLDELEESLYGRDDPAYAGRGRRPAPARPGAGNIRTAWGEVRQRRGPLAMLRFSRMTIIAGAGAALFVAGAAAFTYMYLGSERREVAVEITGRAAVEASEETAVTVTLRNISSVTVEEAELALLFPKGAVVRTETGGTAATGRMVQDIGALAPGEERRAAFFVRFFGGEGDEQAVNASVSYRPGGLKARFAASAERRVAITSVPLAVAWDAPDAVAAGETVPIIVRVSSQARAPLEDLWLRLQYPPGFTVQEAVPAASSTDPMWKIGVLAPGEEWRLALKASFGSTAGERQSLHAGVGIYREDTKEWIPWRESSREVALASSPFFLEGVIGDRREGVINPGDFLSLAVRYRNRSPVPVKNVTVRAALDGAILDTDTLTIGEGGVMDFGTRRIVWGPGGTDALREVLPGQGGELHLAVRVRPRPAIQSAADKNLTVRLVTRIEAASVPEELAGSVLAPEDAVTLKVATVVLASGRTVYRASPIPNTGPLPPKVGEKTTYAVVWEARNFTNEVENAELRASLPPNVRWEGAVSPRDADVRFDAASGEVRWRLGRVAPGVGVLTPARVAAFQISVTPADIDAGRSMALTGILRFSGKDAFTGQDIALETQGVSTQLPQDPLANTSEWTVVR